MFHHNVCKEGREAATQNNGWVIPSQGQQDKDCRSRARLLQVWIHPKKEARSPGPLSWLQARVTAAPGAKVKAASAGGAIPMQQQLKILQRAGGLPPGVGHVRDTA